MAQRTLVELLDDIDGGSATETVRFSLDGIDYEIDLSAANADRLRKSLNPYAGKARKVSISRTRRAGSSAGPRAAGSRERSADIRAWAQQHGIAVNDRGRIPVHVVEAYEANDPSQAKAPAAVPQATFRVG